MIAHRTACVRLVTPIFLKMFFTCVRAAIADGAVLGRVSAFADVAWIVRVPVQSEGARDEF